MADHEDPANGGGGGGGGGGAAVDADPAAAAAHDGGAARPTFKVFVIDTSGSMSDPAQVQTSPGKYEGTGQDLLQLVSTAAAAAASVMTQTQHAGAVSFSSKAAVVSAKKEMSAPNRAAMHGSLMVLRAEGSTNLWDAVVKACEMLLPHWRAHGAEARYSVDLLTDGCPNVEPPNVGGYVASLRDYRRAADGFMPTINTYGFGYNSDVKVLEEIAVETGGHFYFLPSPDMVATNFVNSTAMWGAQEEPPALDAVSDRWRLKFIDALRNMYRVCNLGNFVDAAAQNRGLSEGMRADVPAAIAAAAALAPAAGGAGPALLEMLKDVENQVALAVSDRGFYKVWGHAYIMSLARAHELRICANYKDPGLQFYGGPRFKAIQALAATNFRAALDEAAKAAAAAAPPKAAGGGGGPMRAAVNHAALANLYNPAGGCFDGGCLVTMADGSRKPAREVRVGDLVRPAVGGEAAEVFVVLRTLLPETAEAVQLRGGLIITAWHPVRRDEPGAAWIFPRDADSDIFAKGTAATVGLGGSAPHVIGSDVDPEHVFSFGVRGTSGEAPSEVHGLRVNGMLVASLGHGCKDNSVLNHSFWGTDKVLKAINAMYKKDPKAIINVVWKFARNLNGEVVDLVKDE